MGSINRKKINLRKEKKNQLKPKKQAILIKMVPKEEPVIISGVSRVDLQAQLDAQKNITSPEPGLENGTTKVVSTTEDINNSSYENKYYGTSLIADYRSVKSELF
ncbi:MAG: hypothetical protein KBC11_03325 [Candidatus Pacebacteria bacterium]|nr:hypothetical protein [Candidatus Paceibacterota bacterium]MBP9715519.1 hypothetical protein [Candidatus Paceibacterota bacterium]